MTAVEAGLLSMQEACSRNSLTIEEFSLLAASACATWSCRLADEEDQTARLLIASHHGLNTFDPTEGRLVRVLEPKADQPRNRSNDGGTDATINVTPMISDSGLVSMAVTRSSTVPLGFNSREAAAGTQPQLIVETASGSPETPPGSPATVGEMPAPDQRP